MAGGDIVADGPTHVVVASPAFAVRRSRPWTAATRAHLTSVAWPSGS
ncbi:hypothetical protein [Streptomyces fagopyri]|nr:hypothetical protein [Streptomyces fagopyri]